MIVSAVRSRRTLRGMDLVSDAIAAVRVGRPSSNRMTLTGSWCARFAPYDGAGFHIVLRGGCWLLPDGGGAPVALAAGDAVLLPHGTGHVLADSPADAAAVARAVSFERWLEEDAPPPYEEGAAEAELLCGKYRLGRSLTHPLMAELPDVLHLPHRVGGHAELRAGIDLLGRELAPEARGGSRPGSSIAVPGLLDLLLVYMLRSWLDDAHGSSAASGSWSAALADPVVAAALRAVHEDPAAPWTVARLAGEAGVSRATLARRFTSLVGRSPMAYLGWWRLTLAACMLRETPAPLDAVARQVGYGTPYALSHAFLRLFGTTPGRYRAAATAPAVVHKS